MSVLKKIGHWFANPVYAWRRLSGPVLRVTGYDDGQWSRVVMYQSLFEEVQRTNPTDLSALEISPGGENSPWRTLGFASYSAVDFPEFDICRDRLERQFDLIIADQVFEHILWPYRAARNVFAMLRPGGRFICTTPFLIRVHETPVDCARWTETGLKHLLAEAGFELERITTGSWGSLACVRANLKEQYWARVGWGRSLRNEPQFPVSVWAIAAKGRQSEA